MILVGIVLLNYNGGEDTLECFRSLEIYLKSPVFQYKIYLLDNASRNPLTDEEVHAFKLDTLYKKNDINWGFAGGNNMGMHMAFDDNCQYIMLLNNDTVLTDYSINDTLAYMEANPNIGVAGIVNHYYDKPDEKWQDGWNIDFIHGHGKQVDDSKWGDADFIEADYVPGASMIIKREVMEKTGVLDDSFFAYYEDTDYCARTKKLGYRVGFNPKSHLLHKVSRSSTGHIRNYLRTRNRLLFFSKYSKRSDFFMIYLKLFRRSLNTIRKNYKTSDNPQLLLRSYMWAFSDFNRKKFKEGRIAQLVPRAK